VTRAKQAWCKANRYLKSGQRAKAIYWLEETQRILSEERPSRRRHSQLDLGYMFVAFVALILILASQAYALKAQQTAVNIGSVISSR
jgi:hypothetical protein